MHKPYIPGKFIRKSGKQEFSTLSPELSTEKAEKTMEKAEFDDFLGRWQKLSTVKNVDNSGFIHKFIPEFSPKENEINIRSL